jgi:hypothetical protein
MASTNKVDSRCARLRSPAAVSTRAQAEITKDYSSPSLAPRKLRANVPDLRKKALLKATVKAEEEKKGKRAPPVRRRARCRAAQVLIASTCRRTARSHSLLRIATM